MIIVLGFEGILKLAIDFHRYLFRSDEPDADQSGAGPTRLFLLTVLVYCVYQVAMKPHWMLDGEMWGEMATNYFPNANAADYLTNFFSLDSGYIPLPQRIIAFTANRLNISAALIPYFYTWSSTVCSALLVAVFCLAPFRAIVRSDALRFLTVLAVLLVADFETTSFINFTYNVGFFTSVVTALALVERSRDVPRWAWLTPVLMISKPAVLSALPLMIIVGIGSKLRFRLITLVTTVGCVAQLIQMVASSSAGVMTQAQPATFWSKAEACLLYFPGLLGGFLGSRSSHLNQMQTITAGVVLIVCAGLLLRFNRRRSGALLVAGLFLLFFNVLLNCFIFSDGWNTAGQMISKPPVYRHIVIGFSGCILVAVGLVASLTEGVLSRYKVLSRVGAGAWLFAYWFINNGWLAFAGGLQREPFLNNSQWQTNSDQIDFGVTPLCVPIDPAGWSYRRNCHFLTPFPSWDHGFRTIKQDLALAVLPPALLTSSKLSALAVLARPASSLKSAVKIKAVLQMKDGSSKEYSGVSELTRRGRLIQLIGMEAVTLKDVITVTLTVSSPIEIALTSSNADSDGGILWMGN